MFKTIDSWHKKRYLEMFLQSKNIKLKRATFSSKKNCILVVETKENSNL